MKFLKGQKVAALVRLSLSVEKWIEAIYECEATIGSTADGSPIQGHKVQAADGTARYASKCRLLEPSGKI